MKLLITWKYGVQRCEWSRFKYVNNAYKECETAKCWQLLQYLLHCDFIYKPIFKISKWKYITFKKSLQFILTLPGFADFIAQFAAMNFSACAQPPCV